MNNRLPDNKLSQVHDVLGPLGKWSRQCHAASAHIVNAEIFTEARVARGFCSGVPGQHSWVVIGGDCYDHRAAIIDPTLWSYDDNVVGVWVGSINDGRHRPHGTGSIFDWGRPPSASAKPVKLEPLEPFSDSANLFLDILGPIDEEGWRMLCNAPAEGWPAGEIFTAICDTFSWGTAVIPIDIVGMVTDRNPGGLYLPGEEKK